MQPQHIPQPIPQQITQQYQPIRQPMNIQQSYQPMNAQYNNFQQSISSQMIRQVQPQSNKTSSMSPSSSIPADLPVPLLPTTSTTSISSTKVQQPIGQPNPSATGPMKPVVPQTNHQQQASSVLSNFDLLSDLTSMAPSEPVQPIPQPKLLTEADIIGQCYNIPNQTQK